MFASLRAKLNLWSLPKDTNRAVPNGAPERLTNDAFAHTYPAVSPDGSKVAFSLRRSGNRDVWSSERKRRALVTKTPARVSILDLATQRRTALLEHAKYRLWNPRFSPDDRWVSFNATEPGHSRIFVVPVRDQGAVPEQEWITIADTGWDDKPRWSSGGNTLYLVSERDGFRCIWAQRLDSEKRPLGEVIAVFHAHQTQRSLSNVGPGDLKISVARDKIAST